MATTSTSALFTRSGVLSNASRTPKRRLAASADSRRLVDSAVISKSSGSDFNAGMCAWAAQPRSGLAPMMPTRILIFSFFLMAFLNDRREQFEESGEPPPAEMTQGLLCGFGDVAIETTQQCPAAGRDPIDASTAIVGVGTSHDVSIAFQTRGEASQIGI